MENDTPTIIVPDPEGRTGWDKDSFTVMTISKGNAYKPWPPIFFLFLEQFDYVSYETTIFENFLDRIRQEAELQKMYVILEIEGNFTIIFSRREK